jgi:hypothetical protein
MKAITRATLAALAALGCLCALPGAAAATPAPTWLPIAATGPTVLPPVQSEVQRLAVDAEAGSFTLSFEGQETGAIPFDADASVLEAALDSLASIGGAGGQVTVKGGPGDEGAEHPYFVAFEAALGGSDVPELSANSAGLSGGGTQTASVSTVLPGGPGTTTLAIYAQNVGGASSSGQITVSVELPEGVRTNGTPEAYEPGVWACTPGAGNSAFSCTSTRVVDPSLATKAINAPLVAGPEAAGTREVHVEVEGGGAVVAGYELPLRVSSTPAPPGMQSLAAGAFDEEGQLDTRAGAHPYSAMGAGMINTRRTQLGQLLPVGEFKDIVAELPPGFLGNPIATPQCPDSVVSCPIDTIVGIAQPLAGGFGGSAEVDPLFNIEAPYGYPGKFRFPVAEGFEELSAVGGLRSDEDYGLSVTSYNTPQITPVYGFFVTFWGTPADPSHDAQRCENIEQRRGCGPSGAANTAFLTNATDCAEQALSPPLTKLKINTWQDPLTIFENDIAIPAVTGCDQLKLEGNLTFQPGAGEGKADSTASFSTDLTFPDEGLRDPTKLTTPELRRTVIRFPQGLTLNPSAADGLASCSEAQIGFKGANFPEPNRIRFTKDPNSCPDAAKIGTVEVKSALLENTLHGALYLADQGQGNPFGSLFAVYLVIEDPKTGIYVKLPGRTDPDPNTGQLTATFEDNPQLPFTSLKLNFKGGSRSPFATPVTCGTYTTETEMTPWSAPESGPPLISEDSFVVDSGPNGSPCANTPEQRPFDLGLEAGSANLLAGAFTPFTIRITRPDGAQELRAVEITTPPGFTASLRGIPSCTEAEIEAARARSGAQEQSNPACPAASQVGTTTVGAGAGPHPFYSPGRLYLAGPYKGAPLSVVAITPAVAGPFDLGTVVVRSALHLDPESAQITATSDPLPEFLDGVGIRIRDIRIDLDRSEWAINPTSCEPNRVVVEAEGNSGARANLENRFQVGECGALKFKPKLAIALRGGTRRGDLPALVSTLTVPPGNNANIARVAVTMPRSEFLEQAHLNNICTRVQFAEAACPKGSVYGHATAITPLLDYPLRGPVYLRSNPAHKLPDLLVALRGPASQPIEVDLAGRIDSVHGGIRASFEAVPDAPVTKFVLKMKGGAKGLIINSRDLCQGRALPRVTVRTVAQNNKRADQSPPLRVRCGGKRGKRGKRGAKRA